jgi:hypothetical protein
VGVSCLIKIKIVLLDLLSQCLVTFHICTHQGFCICCIVLAISLFVWLSICVRASETLLFSMFLSSALHNMPHKFFGHDVEILMLEKLSIPFRVLLYILLIVFLLMLVG